MWQVKKAKTLQVIRENHIFREKNIAGFMISQHRWHCRCQDFFRKTL
jgi:hypothetical protein